MKRILLIQTGGTISMNAEGLHHRLDDRGWQNLLEREVPELGKLANLESRRLFFEDSSDIGVGQWRQLIECIEAEYKRYDGFVILHGTDTMAYTASALSFGLQNLSRPVILTGSQVPMSKIRSDARRNLVNAIEMATLSLCEVAICFNDYVYRGNRTTKMSIGDFDAFASPNFPPLAEIGLNIELRHPSTPSGKSLAVHSEFSDDLFVLKLYPGLDPAYMEALPLDDIRVIVLEAFGSGNFPIKDVYSLLPFLERCRQKDVSVIITSQAPYDAVDLTKYESGRKALELGAIGARDMTVEATVTKLMYLLGTGCEGQQLREKFLESLAGEMTR